MKELFLIVFLFHNPFASELQKGKMVGKVIDHVNEPIEGAVVEIMSNNKMDSRAYTDENGEWEMKLPIGIYTVEVCADSSIDYIVTHIPIRDSRGTEVNSRLRKVEPEKDVRPAIGRYLKPIVNACSF